MSVGMHLEGHAVLSAVLSDVLLGVCVAAFVVLLSLDGWRLLGYRKALVGDFLAPDRAFGFFTFVAGTNVLAPRSSRR